MKRTTTTEMNLANMLEEIEAGLFELNRVGSFRDGEQKVVEYELNGGKRIYIEVDEDRRWKGLYGTTVKEDDHSEIHKVQPSIFIPSDYAARKVWGLEGVNENLTGESILDYYIEQFRPNPVSLHEAIQEDVSPDKSPIQKLFRPMDEFVMVEKEKLRLLLEKIEQQRMQVEKLENSVRSVPMNFHRFIKELDEDIQPNANAILESIVKDVQHLKRKNPTSASLPPSNLDFENILRLAVEVIEQMPVIEELDVRITGMPIVGTKDNGARLVTRKHFLIEDQKWGDAKEKFFDRIEEPDMREEMARDIASAFSEGLDPSDGDTLYIMSFLGLIAHEPPMNDTVGVRARLAVAEAP